MSQRVASHSSYPGTDTRHTDLAGMEVAHKVLWQNGYKAVARSKLADVPRKVRGGQKGQKVAEIVNETIVWV